MWHFSNSDNSTPVLLIKFGLVTNIRSVQQEDSLVYEQVDQLSGYNHKQMLKS